MALCSNTGGFTLQVQGDFLPIHRFKILSLSETSAGAVPHMGTVPVPNGLGQ